MLIFIYYALYIRWLSFYLFVSHYLLRLGCDVTCCVLFHKETMAVCAQFLSNDSYESKCAG